MIKPLYKGFICFFRTDYVDNNCHLFKTILSLFTKFPLAIIWVLNMLSVLSPGGRTAAERRRNRGSSLIILTILTPIMSALVVEREGSLFNPVSWFRGRRIGSVRNNL